jgi:hypothetical protein
MRPPRPVHKGKIVAAALCLATAASAAVARESWPMADAATKERLESYDKHREEVDARIKPELEAWAKKGKPFIPWASKLGDLPQATIPAFPGAFGGGIYSFGGRGGKVYVVTSLDDAGPGTLREACEAAGPRIVVFAVAGIIHLKMPIYIEAPYITIAGQTAPGDGVCVAGQGFEDNAHDVVIRYLRMRRGDPDIFNRHGTHYGNPAGDIVLDHLSASWGSDQNLDTYRHIYQPPEGGPSKKLPSVNVTIQWCISSEALNTYNHAFGGDWGGLNTGFHHNLFACNTGRNPSIALNFDFNFADNVLFNWRHRTVDGGDEKSTINMINNYYKPGPVTPDTDVRHRIVLPALSRSKLGQKMIGKVYAAGNVVEGDPTVTADNWAGGVQVDTAADPDATDNLRVASGAQFEKILAMVKVDKPFPMAFMPVEPAKDAYEHVLANAGASLPKRDPVDVRVIEAVRTGKVWGEGESIPIKPVKGLAKNDLGVAGNGIITDISQVGGYPEYKGDPIAYPQHDGIPDWWKKKYNLDVNDPDLATKDCNGDGYTNIEKFIDGIDPSKKVDWHDPKNNADVLTAAALQPPAN